jgi:hypothetical protein
MVPIGEIHIKSNTGYNPEKRKANAREGRKWAK